MIRTNVHMIRINDRVESRPLRMTGLVVGRLGDWAWVCWDIRPQDHEPETYHVISLAKIGS